MSLVLTLWKRLDDGISAGLAATALQYLQLQDQGGGSVGLLGPGELPLFGDAHDTAIREDFPRS